MIAVRELQQRRAALVKAMSSDSSTSVAVIPAAREVVRSNDTHFPFRQDSDFWYLTGIAEPDAVLVIQSGQSGQGGKSGEPPRSTLFVLPKDPTAEIWHGRRLGVEKAKAIAGVTQCFTLEELPEQLPALLDGFEHLYLAQQDNLWIEPQVKVAMAALRSGRRQGKRAPRTVNDLNPLVHEQRLIKSPAEIALMKQACMISAQGMSRAMNFVEPEQFEYQVAAELHHEFVMHGASGPAYGTICGSGENACILHYTENSSRMTAGDLLLIDAGAEYAGYAGDISRTFPVNGRFSPSQRKLYQVVLAAHEAALAELKPGATLPAAYRAAVRVLTEGMVKLGILRGEVDSLIQDMAFRPYFMHGLGHWLGLDVHDVGEYQQDGKPRPLQPGMVLTIEPGLYIPADADVPESYRGLGIRIEDDILITETGFENLTAMVPKSIEGIEALMARGKASARGAKPVEAN
ncbi:MAG: Xaa-Pro aminopeptidase [Idiomarina sp.]|nr:Xaa-Pro aminopeptidase [Idiomarina sp.]